jgi:phosphoribosyl 1,2-cyclic phosphodiesterase
LRLGFASLGSGSQGNATLVRSAGTAVLVDCGFGPRELTRRLATHGLCPEDIDAILVTHEHTDHIGGAGAVARRWGIPLWMTTGTRLAAPAGMGEVPFLGNLRGEDAVEIGALRVCPVTVPHDAREPRQFVIEDGRSRLGVCTDLGSSTAHVVAAFSGCDGLLLEFNHDETLLANSEYPPFLKERILSDWGHLSNAQAAALLANVAHGGLKAFVAAHLSEKNNLPALVRAQAADVLGAAADEILIATQEDGSPWLEL